MPVMQRAAAIQPKTLNKEKRTVDVIFTKGARVFRQGFFTQSFFEELGLEKKNVRMGRMESGNSPVLDSHGMGQRAGIKATIGVVEKAELIVGKRGEAKLRFSKRDDVTEIFNDIEDGIIRNVSVGYNTFKFEKVGEENDVPIFRAIDWEPVEISVVAAGADAGSVIRSKDEQMTDCVFTDEVEGERENEPETPPENPDPETKPLENKNKVRQTEPNGGNDMDPKELAKKLKEEREAGAKAENVRQIEIRSIVKKVGLDEKIAAEYIEGNKTVDEVRTLAIDALAKKDEKPENQTPATNVDLGDDLGRKGRIEGMTNALLHRFRPQSQETKEKGQKVTLPGYELVDVGRDYAYFSLVDMARACLEGANIRTGMLPKHKIADMVLGNERGLHSTSDFPEILANVANKTLRGGYLAAPQTWKPFTNEVFVSDFKEISRTNLGDAPPLLRLEEGSEVKRGTMSEAAEKYRVEEFARVIALSRKVIINDDLAAFTRVPERFGRRAADLESDTVWQIIKDNAALADTFALYSAQHGNLSTAPGAPSEVLLGEGRKLMRRQVGLDGAEISITPVWLYVPPEHETVAEKLIAQTRPNNASDVNPFGPSGRTTLLLDVEPRLETGVNGSLTSWFLFADKGQIDMVEIAFLEGTSGPQIQTRDGFDINGVEIKIMHDLGAKAIDFRGMFKNAGA